MLVLTRSVDKEVIIGDSIVVTVVEIRGDKVKLGFSAPSSVPIHRREVWEAIQREREIEADKPATRISEQDND